MDVSSKFFPLFPPDPVSGTSLTNETELLTENSGSTPKAEPQLSSSVMEQNAAFVALACDSSPPTLTATVQTYGGETQLNMSGTKEKVVCNAQTLDCEAGKRYTLPSMFPSKVEIYRGQTQLSSGMEENVIVGQLLSLPAHPSHQEAYYGAQVMSGLEQSSACGDPVLDTDLPVSNVDLSDIFSQVDDVLQDKSSDILDWSMFGGLDPNSTSEHVDLTVGVQHPVSTGKMGSQAFQYVKSTAVQETDGTLITSNYSGTSEPYGILSVDPKLNIVPEKNPSIPISILDACGTPTIDSELFTVPKLVTVSEEDTNIPIYLSNSSDASPIELSEKATSSPSCHSKTYGTVPIHTIQTTMSDKPISPPDTESEACTTLKKKRRKRRRAGEEAEQPKVRMYEKEPQTDLKEERKRKDALRAKKCRDKKREEVNYLKEKLEKEKEEKYLMKQELEKEKKEKDLMAEELVGRRSHEKVVLQLLWEKYKILVIPYGTPREEVPSALQPQTSV